MTSTIEISDNNDKNEKLTVNNNYGFKKPKEHKFHYYNTDFEEYNDVIIFIIHSNLFLNIIFSLII